MLGEAPPLGEAPARSRRRGRIAAVAGAVLLAGAVVAAVGYTVVTVRDADRDTGVPTWKFPERQADDGKAPGGDSEMLALLVPYEEDRFVMGPDIAGFGADAELNGREADALRKENLADLPRSVRQELEQEIDENPVTGMAMRSYLYDERFAVADGKAFPVSVVLQRMENRTAVGEIAAAQNELFEAVGLFRAGPEIKGHDDAGCFLTPEDEFSPIGVAVCAASRGDVLVTVTASAAGEVDGKVLAGFLADQLDRIDSPGEAV